MQLDRQKRIAEGLDTKEVAPEKKTSERGSRLAEARARKERPRLVGLGGRSPKTSPAQPPAAGRREGALVKTWGKDLKESLG
ncbi:MAG: hypothetical protein KGZ96_05720 [Clostridia bacterium]|jgi:hypothetical protein|nr:hypothetical protein [Clostridia bacterium]